MSLGGVAGYAAPRLGNILLSETAKGLTNSHLPESSLLPHYCHILYLWYALVNTFFEYRAEKTGGLLSFRFEKCLLSLSVLHSRAF